LFNNLKITGKEIISLPVFHVYLISSNERIFDPAYVMHPDGTQ
jgi:hypothetical protein